MNTNTKAEFVKQLLICQGEIVHSYKDYATIVFQVGEDLIELDVRNTGNKFKQGDVVEFSISVVPNKPESESEQHKRRNTIPLPRTF